MITRLKFLFWKRELLVLAAIVLVLLGARAIIAQAFLSCPGEPDCPNQVPSVGVMNTTGGTLISSTNVTLNGGNDPVAYRINCGNGDTAYWSGWDYNTSVTFNNLICDYSSAGTYTVTVSVADFDGDENHKPKTVVVSGGGGPVCVSNGYQCGNCLDDDGDGARDFATPNGGGPLDAQCNAANDDYEGPTTPYFGVIVTTNVDPSGPNADWMTNSNSGPRYKNPAFQYYEGPFVQGGTTYWSWKTIVDINGQGSVTTNPINIPAGWTYEILEPWHNPTQNYSGRASDSPLRWKWDYNTGTPPPPPVTTLDSVTISSPVVNPNNITQYTIVVTSTDTAGAANVTAQYALINYQGENAGAYRGYLTMYYPGASNPWPGAKNPMSCTGGGWAAIQLSYGSTYLNLDSCTVSTAGNVRTTTFTVRFDPSFTTPATNNDISGYTVGNSSGPVGWTNFQTNFALANVAPTTSNVKSAEPDYCTVGPSINASWTYSDPEGTPQRAYQVQVDDNAGFSSPNFDSGIKLGTTTAYYISSGMTWDTTYRLRVRTWDTPDLPSAWTIQSLCTGPPGNPSGCSGDQKSWKSPRNQYPNNVSTFTWTPNRPPVDETVQFDDGNTRCYKTPPNTPDTCLRWDWTWGDGTPGVNQQNPTHIYTNYGAFTVTLRAQDQQNGYACSASKTINIQRPIPNWREVLPQ